MALPRGQGQARLLCSAAPASRIAGSGSRGASFAEGYRLVRCDLPIRPHAGRWHERRLRPGRRRVARPARVRRPRSLLVRRWIALQIAVARPDLVAALVLWRGPAEQESIRTLIALNAAEDEPSARQFRRGHRPVCASGSTGRAGGRRGRPVGAAVGEMATGARAVRAPLGRSFTPPFDATSPTGS